MHSKLFFYTLLRTSFFTGHSVEPGTYALHAKTLHIVQHVGKGGWVTVPIDENQITLFLCSRQRKQASAHEQTAHLSLPVTLPLPLVQPIISQLLGVGGKTKISRTSLMHSHCIMHIKKAQTSTRVTGPAGWRLL